MGEVSEEIELDLGLSIGRSFKRSEKSNPDSAAREFHAPPSAGERCEIHALRRQEAKRRRSGDLVSDDEKGRSGARVGEEIDSEEVQCEKKKNNNKIEDGSTNPNSNQMQFPIVQVQFPYPPIQYVPLSNGFAIPYVVPCWAANGSAPAAAGGGEKQAACRSFVPFQANVGSEANNLNGCESEQNGSGGIRRAAAASNGSPMCSSSVVSDNRSSSHEGVNSGETRSHTSHSRPDQPQTTDGAQIKFEHSPSSNILQATQSSVKAIQNEKAAAVSNMSLHSNPAAPNREANGPKHVKKPAASNITQSSIPVTEVQTQVAAPETQTGPAKTKPVSEGETGKPSKPQAQNPCLPQMPCVSTMGNGPNGKTVTGFLYRYTNAEVSIVCVCHGSSFSPAEFVAHAGGTDISNPLRHITVIPSALG